MLCFKESAKEKFPRWPSTKTKALNKNLFATSSPSSGKPSGSSYGAMSTLGPLDIGKIYGQLLLSKDSHVNFSSHI